MIEDGPGSHLSTLIALLIFTGVFTLFLYGLENKFVLLLALMEDCKEYC